MDSANQLMSVTEAKDETPDAPREHYVIDRIVDHRPSDGPAHSNSKICEKIYLVCWLPAQRRHIRTNKLFGLEKGADILPTATTVTSVEFKDALVGWTRKTKRGGNFNSTSMWAPLAPCTTQPNHVTRVRSHTHCHLIHGCPLLKMPRKMTTTPLRVQTVCYYENHVHMNVKGKIKPNPKLRRAQYTYWRILEGRLHMWTFSSLQSHRRLSSLTPISLKSWQIAPVLSIPSNGKSPTRCRVSPGGGLRLSTPKHGSRLICATTFRSSSGTLPSSVPSSSPTNSSSRSSTPHWSSTSSKTDPCGWSRGMFSLGCCTSANSYSPYATKVSNRGPQGS